MLYRMCFKYKYFILLLSFLLLSCHHNNFNNKSVSDTLNVEKKYSPYIKELYPYVQIKEINGEKVLLIKYWAGIPIIQPDIPKHLLWGKWIVVDNDVYLTSAQNYSSVLFRFQKPIETRYNFSFIDTFKNILHKTTKLDTVHCKVSIKHIIYDSIAKDSVYGFLFKDHEYYFPGSKYLFWVSQRRGILGIVNAYFDNKEIKVLAGIGETFIYDSLCKTTNGEVRLL